MLRLALALCCLALTACPAPTPTPDAGDPWSEPGPHPIGVTHFTLSSTDGGRSLPVELWYPAVDSAKAASAEGFGVETFESDPARQAQLTQWLAATNEKCSPRRALGARDAAPIDGPLPLLLFSHCTECFRFSFHSVAERLASRGFVVAAADHVDNTHFDGTAPITNAFLAVRADDVSSLLTAMLDAQDARVPMSLRGKVDSTRVAVFGHSFGAVTAGKVVELDARVKAGFLVAAPVDSPFLNSGAVSRVTRPLSWLLAMEDNSISYLGNGFIRDNFSKTPRPNVLIEVENAGHWTFSDIAGLGGAFLPGCGDGLRDPDGGAFTYLDNDVGRAVAMRTLSAWAEWTLNGDEAAATALKLEIPSGTVHVKQR
ncbi:MAG: hypothetical protein U0228_26390 [Myxococcaceae bacterium]